MIHNKKTYFFLSLILFVLLLRDLPYINILVIDKVWILYVFILLLLALWSIRIKIRFIIYFSFIILVISLFLSIIQMPRLFEGFKIVRYLQLPSFLEGVGIVIYFFLLIFVIYKIYFFTKSLDD